MLEILIAHQLIHQHPRRIHRPAPHIRQLPTHIRQRHHHILQRRPAIRLQRHRSHSTVHPIHHHQTTLRTRPATRRRHLRHQNILRQVQRTRQLVRRIWEVLRIRTATTRRHHRTTHQRRLRTRQARQILTLRARQAATVQSVCRPYRQYRIHRPVHRLTRPRAICRVRHPSTRLALLIYHRRARLTVRQVQPTHRVHQYTEANMRSNLNAVFFLNAFQLNIKQFYN